MEMAQPAYLPTARVVLRCIAVLVQGAKTSPQYKAAAVVATVVMQLYCYFANRRAAVAQASDNGKATA